MPEKTKSRKSLSACLIRLPAEVTPKGDNEKAKRRLLNQDTRFPFRQNRVAKTQATLY